MGSIELGLFAAIMVVLAGLLAERAWRWRNDKKHNNNNPGNPALALWEVKQDVASVKSRLETFAEVTDNKFDDLRERVTKLEMKEES